MFGVHETAVNQFIWNLNFKEGKVGNNFDAELELDPLVMEDFYEFGILPGMSGMTRRHLGYDIVLTEEELALPDNREEVIRPTQLRTMFELASWFLIVEKKDSLDDDDYKRISLGAMIASWTSVKGHLEEPNCINTIKEEQG
jgi:hypothetical protein